MKNDIELLLDIPRREYHKETDFYIVCSLPEKVKYKIIDDNLLKVRYSSDLFHNPMTGDNIFEGWLIIFYRWGIFDKIEFEWEKSDDTADEDYLSVIDRINRFIDNFGSVIHLSDKCAKEIKDVSGDADGKYNDKLIVESIINTTWYFETGNEISFEFPDNVSVKIENGAVTLSETSAGGIQEIAENSKAPYSPLELIVNRWTYLKCRYEGVKKAEPEPVSESLADTLIKVGYTERNLLYPTEF